MKAYDLGFGADPDSLVENPSTGEPIPGHGAVRAGWTNCSGPGIERDQWPRSPNTGLPMMHWLTLLLPDDYRRRGSGLPAIAFFVAQYSEPRHGFVTPVGDAGSEDPYLRDLAAHRPHPMATIFADLIGGHFALIWLTQAEFDAGPTPPPPDVRRSGEHQYDWDAEGWIRESEPQGPQDTMWLVERPDPNTGLTPSDEDGVAYQQPFDEDSQYRPWSLALPGRSHLGGTAFHAQMLPSWMTPWYLQLEEIGRVNFGTGNGLLDLESGTFEWAC